MASLFLGEFASEHVRSQAKFTSGPHERMLVDKHHQLSVPFLIA